MNKIFLIQVLCLTTLVVSSVSAESLDLTPEYSFQLPFPHPVYQTVFGDIDGDGTPEVLARMINFVALYSISGDSLLFRRKFGGDTIITSIVFSDVNRDHVSDIVVGLGHLCVEECPLYSLEVLDGSTQFQSLGSFEYRAGDEPWNSLWPEFVTSYMGVLVLQSVDLNHDGVNELFFSFDNRRHPDPRFPDIYSEGCSYLFHSFPDSILWKSDNSYLSLMPIEQPGGNSSFLTEDGWYETGFYFENVNSSVWSLNPDGSKSILATTPFDVLCTAPYESHFFYRPLCSGQISTLIDSATFLVSASGWAICDSGSRSLGNQIQLRRFTPGDTNNLIWSREKPAAEFAFHPAHPGYFFGIAMTDSLVSSNAVHLYKGNDGSEIATSNAISATFAQWDTSFPDGFPRIIALQENRVTVYRIEVSTTVEKGPWGEIPNAFTVKRPYPNPFNAEVTIPLSLPRKADVKVEVYNLLGQKIADLWSGSMNPGEQVVRWNAGHLPSAVYFVKVTALGETKTAKVVLLK